MVVFQGVQQAAGVIAYGCGAQWPVLLELTWRRKQKVDKQTNSNYSAVGQCGKASV